MKSTIKNSGSIALSLLCCLLITAQDPMESMADNVGLSDESRAIIKIPQNIANNYDFWIGDWEVSWDEGEGKVGKGTNSIRHIVNGKAIEENFEITEGQSQGFLGKSISIYDQNQKLWKQVWVDSQNGYFDFTGDTDGANRIFKTTIKKEDKEIELRMVFKDIRSNSFIWDWESSVDGGKTWELKWRIIYKRKNS